MWETVSVGSPACCTQASLTRTTESCKPDHDLVLVRAGSGGRSEHIVADICYHVRARVAPVKGRLHRGDGGQLLRREGDDRVWVRLHVVGATFP